MMDPLYSNKRKDRSLLDLHDDILVMIFTRLSFTKILECKTVCKSLSLLLSSRYFAESYKSNPPFTSLIIHTGSIFSLLELNSGYNYLHKPSKPKILPDPFGLSFCGPFGMSCYGVRTRFLVGSCNGFFCYCDKDLLYVTNPLSGTYVRLPEVVVDGVSTSSYGFGFCPQTQHYKVIELATYVRPFSRTEVNVFTVGIDKSWRRIHSPFQRIQLRFDMDYPLIQFSEVNGKGYLHWIVEDVNRLDYLYSFDILEEKVVPIPPPVGLKKRNEYSTDLLSKNGCICLLHMKENEKKVEFWCMTEYMVQDSWSLRIISESSFPPILTYLSDFHAVAAWNDDEILLLSQHNYIVSCNLEQNNFNKLDMNIPRYVCQAAVRFVPNFFSNLETGTGTTQADTKDAAARMLGLLSQKSSKPTEVGNGRANLMDNIFSRVFIKCCNDVYNYGCMFLSDPTVHPIILCDKASPRFLFELKSNLKGNVKDCPLLAATPSLSKITIIGSYNGLFCLSVFNGHHPDHQTHDICICNPVLQEVTILPRHDRVKRIRDEAYGFGFSSISGHYKVLRILTRKQRPAQLEAYVLTIGIDKNWRQVAVGGGTSFRLPKKWPANINKARFCDVAFNNAIHWVAEGDSRIMIYAFDIDEERMSLLSPVPGMYNTEYKRVYPCLGILGGCLCVFVLRPAYRDVVEYWSMTSYGSVASWTRESIFVSLPRVERKVVVPVMSWRDEEEILMWVEDGGGTLISYCSRKKRYTKTKIDVAAKKETLIAVPYVQSDLSLRDAFQNGDLEVNKMVI